MNKGRKKNRIVLLYEKYLSENISRSEYDELFDFLQSEENQRLISDMIDDSVPSYLEGLTDKKSDAFTPEQNSIVRTGEGRRRKYYQLSIAASILLILMATVLYYVNRSAQMMIYTTGNHETMRVELPDGSAVVMNANSELKFSKKLVKAEHRMVEFSGEGYFDVVRQDGKLFTVRTGSVDVDVLGTEFNLESRRDFTHVFLKSGKVVLHSDLFDPVELLPGDLVKVNKESKVIDKSSDYDTPVDSWKEGVFTFTDLTAIEILNKMEDIYGKEFIIEDSTGLDDIIVVQGLPYIDWDFTREALELALDVELTDSLSNLIIVKK